MIHNWLIKRGYRHFTDEERQVLADLLIDKIVNLIDENKIVPPELGVLADKLLPNKISIGNMVKIDKYGSKLFWGKIGND